jgi:thiamine pyrophosphate-dependent acetolactate synthase large subunit-like protein
MGSQTIGDLLRGVSAELARDFDDVEIPPTVASVFGPRVHAETLELVRYDLGTVDDRVVLLVGPYALRHADGLAAAAAHLNAPVANTWGAKGILRWDSPHHMGTCGLQADDFALLDFARYDLIVTSGLDERESPRERYALAPVVDVQPKFLATLPGSVAPRAFPIEPNDLYGRIAAVAQPGYVDESHPRHPARAVMDLKQSLDPDSIVFGQPGPAGLWLARTFPTDRPGSICVPSVPKPGIAAALTLAATVHGRQAVAVVTDPVDDATREVLDAAPDAIRVEVWGDDVDWSRTRDLIDAAGPVVAWT